MSDVLTTREALERLKVRKAETLHKMRRRGQLKAFKVGSGHEWRWSAESIDKLISGPVETERVSSRRPSSASLPKVPSRY